MTRARVEAILLPEMRNGWVPKESDVDAAISVALGLGPADPTA